METPNFKNYKNSFNYLNPFYFSQKPNAQKINGNSSYKTIETRNTKKRCKNKLSKKQAINFNLSQIKKSKKILLNNDIKNYIYNTINLNDYNTQKNNKIKKRIKIPESEISQSRNFNKFNNNSISNTIMSSFSLTNDIISYSNQNTKKEYNLETLKENGIKYCFDEEGNPMDILDIKTKNKNPIAFIIQTANKNLLMDTNNKIIPPNNNGDYTLTNLPYIIIHKYDVLHPELRVINSNNKENIDNINNFKSIERKNNNKSSNFYNIGLKDFNGLNENSENLENNKVNFHFFSPIIKPKVESYKYLNNNINKQKRKYIFVNRLYDFNKSVQLKLSGDDNEDKNKSLTKVKFQINDNTLNDTYFKQNGHFSTNNNDNNKNNSQFIKDNGANNLIALTKIIKQNKISNDLEFKFERKYKSINSSLNQEQNTSIVDNKGNINKKNDIKLLDYFNSIPRNNNIKKAKKFILNQNRSSKFELNNFKRHRFSNSLNEYILNPLIKSKQIPKKNNNTPGNSNYLTTFNQSLVSPPTEKTTFSTIQKNNNESENNITLKKPNLKGCSGNKYYLKPKIKSAKFFHKRINTENFNTQQNFKFIQSIENKYNKIHNNNYVTPFTLTEADFNKNKKIHDSKCNNSVCKCPYCHNLIYS